VRVFYSKHYNQMGLANDPTSQSKIQLIDVTLRRRDSEATTTLFRYVCQEVPNGFPRTFQGLAPLWKVFM